MAVQHKRPGRSGKQERIDRLKSRLFEIVDFTTSEGRREKAKRALRELGVEV